MGAFEEDLDRQLDTLVEALVRDQVGLQRVERELRRRSLLEALRRSKTKVEASQKLGLTYRHFNRFIDKMGKVDKVIS